MVSFVIGIHAALGEMSAIGFLWIFIELLNPSAKGIKRIRIISLISVMMLFLSWFSGGYYYTNTYGKEVKPLIEDGPNPWAHEVFMETKEHVFLFLPILSLLTYYIIKKYEINLIKNKELRKYIILLCLMIFLLAFAMGAMGYLISSGARAAMEAKL